MPIRLSFFGAAQSVTGSCFLLETLGARVLVDCGMFQGAKTEKELNYRAFPFRESAIDAVLLTHAHIDHSGLIPKLVKGGFAGPILATAASIDLCAIMLRDSGHIQENEVRQLNRRNARRGRDREVDPIYTAEDAERSLIQFKAVTYHEWALVAPGVRARFWNAGHLLGSASVEVELEELGGDTRMRILFSGDIGPQNKLLQPNPEAPRDFDYLVCESTYGDRDRIETNSGGRRLLLRDEVRAAARRNGVLLVPSFAVERTQELLVDLVGLMKDGEIPPTPIYVDSPLATKASGAFQQHASELEHGDELVAALQGGNVRFTETVEQSKALDLRQGFHVIIAASGMCEAGRIRHRLKNWLWREDATVLFVGFQAQGTLGRILQDGARRVRIQGEDIDVRARIRSLDMYSGHADGSELEAWVRERLPLRLNLFLVHGEEPAIAAMRMRLSRSLRPEQILSPLLDDTYELTANGAEPVAIGLPRRISPDQIGRLDWHNERSRLLLDIDEAMDKAADERSRGVMIRRLRRALAGEE
ncbi:MBL fold metallo-hydrolase [Bosea sp. 2YAB26]|uniref:MBL fold metallo-hydrolase RNA specificity domain-containing protein n=2 Tax=Pseudomonadota TaxID=1224 RepID=UPI003F935D02